ncbi:MAG: RibD family protein [Oscillatoriales cyanobacterium RM2_1_1]|nr:RibD family protein [Oscillatoriales cyanobacterium SM2_3_0]NJO44574.1 RibD family protein [Oscillatoriales cyanobacterium RM2_1_1]
MNRPHTTVILAMSADGKIADRGRSPARFSSTLDRIHLEQRVAEADGVLFGRGTLDAYGSTLRVTTESLLDQRQQGGKSPQPVQILCSPSGQIDFDSKFFQQPVPRWWLTTAHGAWQQGIDPQRLETQNQRLKAEAVHLALEPHFERILMAETIAGVLDWSTVLQQCFNSGIQRLAVLGGGQLVGSLVELGYIDELWLTICPLILGGSEAPTPVEGKGFLAQVALRLQLLSVNSIDQEVFLHYRFLSE